MGENDKLVKRESTAPKKVLRGRPKKAVKFELARDFLFSTKPITPEESAELNRVFPEEDLKAGTFIYLLRTRKKMNKSRLQRVLSMDHRSLDRFYGTITLSEYLVLCIEEWIGQPDDTLPVTAPEIPQGTQFDERLDIKRQSAMEQIIDSMVFDPTKIMDASLEELSGAYEKIHKVHRLENGQSTNNNSNFVNSTPEMLQANLRAQKEMLEMTKRLTKIMEKHDHGRAISDDTAKGI